MTPVPGCGDSPWVCRMDRQMHWMETSHFCPSAPGRPASQPGGVMMRGAGEGAPGPGSGSGRAARLRPHGFLLMHSPGAQQAPLRASGQTRSASSWADPSRWHGPGRMVHPAMDEGRHQHLPTAGAAPTSGAGFGERLVLSPRAGRGTCRDATGLVLGGMCPSHRPGTGRLQLHMRARAQPGRTQGAPRCPGGASASTLLFQAPH